ncbi:MAG: hypothetical protein HFJ55_04605 [Clostridia bacterium]|nr:hypothetical protein [Clostridia bacterium]
MNIKKGDYEYVIFFLSYGRKDISKHKDRSHYSITNVTEILNVYYNSVNSIDNIQKRNKIVV